MTNRPLVATDFDDGLACSVEYIEHHIGPSLRPVRVDVMPGPDTHVGLDDLRWPDRQDRERR